LVLLGATLCAGCATGQTGTPYGVAGTGAAVFGTVVSDTGGQLEYWVEFGTTTAYGSETPHQTTNTQPNNPAGVLVSINGLQRATTYHYRVCARDSQQKGGPGCGEDKQFTTVNVDCGDPITADLRLSGDLDCIRAGGANGDGAVVGADGIDIDLAGHTISGESVALENSGFDDVTIHHGSLYAFGTALELDGASRNLIRFVGAGRLDDQLAPSTSTGVRIQGGEANVVRHSTLAGASLGLSATNSPGLLVADSIGHSGSGSRGGGTAVFIDGDLARVLRNTFTAGVVVDGSSNRIVDNDVRAVGFGIDVFAGHDNLVAANDVRDTGVLPFMTDAGDGIIVRAEAVGTRLRGNVATSNSDDGIDVRSATTRLRDNRADDNGDFGIDAVSGVVDLGGNTASGNGNPLQCRNVACP
jgi:parallel beta-helix repeat protein